MALYPRENLAFTYRCHRQIFLRFWFCLTPMLHKQYGKRLLNDRYHNAYSKVSTIFWMSPTVNSKNGAVFLILFTLQESWRTSYPRLPRDLRPVLSRDRGSRLQLVIFLGGLMAALLGFVILIPVLKTRGHYAALVTIAFALLFKTFLEVNDTLGGPQGLKCAGLNLFGWDFNQDIVIGSFEGSFYLGYIAVILLMTIGGFILARRMEDSWIGLNMDAVRLDETVSACFGQSISRWKITAFTIGNFYCGVAGAFYAMMLGYIAPTNFTFGDSLILLSIVILGGLGSMWGTVVATGIVILIPEKFQVLQEYRFLLFSALVIAILLFRPQGLLPRPLRSYITLKSPLVK